MKKENILVVVLICIVFAGGFIFYQSQPSNASEPDVNEKTLQAKNSSLIEWKEFESGINLAKRQNKFVFLYFYADWCTYCKKLKQTTFKDKDVLRYLDKNFISIKVNTDIERQVATDWKVRGLPTSWFLEPDSKKVDSIPGYIDEKQFLTVLKYINTKSYDNMSFNEFMKSN